jgi:hypothetical protein
MSRSFLSRADGVVIQFRQIVLVIDHHFLDGCALSRLHSHPLMPVRS